MNVNGINKDSYLNIVKKNNIKKEDFKNKKKLKDDIAKINMVSSKTTIDSFEKAKENTLELSKAIKKDGQDLIDSSKLSGSKVFDLLN
ncbi:MAG: hypothetical protein ACQESP_07925 [Candidatus Muiribacteriota bacterium]